MRIRTIGFLATLAALGAAVGCNETRRIVNEAPAAGAAGGPGVADPINTRVAVDRAAGIPASGTEAVAVTVTVLDANGSPVAGQTVTLEVSGSENVVTQPAGPTDASGRAEGAVASRKAEQKSLAARVTRSDGTFFYPVDRPALAFVGDPATIGAGASSVSADRSSGVTADGVDPAGIEVVLRDANGNPVAGRTVALALDGVRVAQLPPTNEAGLAIGFVTTTRAGARTIAASDADGGTAIGQVVVEFVAGPPVKLAFLGQPADRKPLHALPAIEVAVQDQFGNTVTTPTAVIRLSATGLLGTTERSAVSGTATFPGLSMAKLGADQRIVAAADNLSSAISSRFDVLLFEDAVRFALAAGQFPTTIAAADLDGANGPDLVLGLDFAGGVHVLLNDGSGAFAAALGSPYPTVVSIPNGITVTGLDSANDAFPDVIVTDQSSTDVTPLLGDGTGALAVTTAAMAGPGTPRGLRAADLNGDGKVDVAVARELSGSVAVLLGDGLGGLAAPVEFQFNTQQGPADLEIADLNGDSFPDLLVADKGFLGFDVRLRKPAPLDFATDGFDPSLGPFQTASAARRLRAGEFDGQPGLDVAVASRISGTQSTLEVFPGDGTGIFSLFATSYRSVTIAGGEPAALATGDLNDDGTADFAMGFTQRAFFGLVLADATGKLRDLTDATATAVGTGSSTHGLVAADLNGDGLLDLAVIQTETAAGAVYVLLQRP